MGLVPCPTIIILRWADLHLQNASNVPRCRYIEHLLCPHIDLHYITDMVGSANRSGQMNAVCHLMAAGFMANGLIRRAVCGACKVGKLVPLFSQPAPRALKTKAGSRMAPVKTQGMSFLCHTLQTATHMLAGSPCSIAPPSSLYHGEGTVAPHPTPGPEQKVYSDHPSGSDSDLEILTMVLGEVNISAGHS